MNEPRTQWRPLFFNLLADSVRNCTSIPEAAQLINQQLWGIFHVHYVPDCTPLFMSPPQVRLSRSVSICCGLTLPHCQAAMQHAPVLGCTLH